MLILAWMCRPRSMALNLTLAKARADRDVRVRCDRTSSSYAPAAVDGVLSLNLKTVKIVGSPRFREHTEFNLDQVCVGVVA